MFPDPAERLKFAPTARGLGAFSSGFLHLGVAETSSDMYINRRWLHLVAQKLQKKKTVRTYVSITMDTFQRLSHSLPALASKHNQLEGPGPLRPSLAGPPDIQLTGRAFLVGFHGALRSSTGKSKDIIKFLGISPSY